MFDPRTVFPARRVSALLSAAALSVLSALTAVQAEENTTSTVAETAKADSSSAADRAFKAVYDKDWAFRLQQFPELAASLGDQDAERRFSDWSDAAVQTRIDFLKQIQRELKQINPDQLTGDGRVNYRIFADQTRNSLADYELGGYLMPFTSDTQFWADYARSGDYVQCQPAANCERYLDRLEQLPQLFQQLTALMRKGLKKGLSVPQVVLTGRDASIALHVVDSAEQSAFYAPFKQLPSALDEASQTALRARAASVIQDKVIPAYRELLQFMRSEYMPKARKTIAASKLPNGNAYYAAEIFEYTTLDASPDSIHQTGLAEVARIRAEMDAIRQQVNFAGDLKAFLQFLRTDPQFYPKTGHELLAEASYFAKKIDGKLPQYFGTLPRQPYGVAPVPADIAPTYTTGRYSGSNDPKQAGFYWVNTSLLDQRPLWAIPALTLHEAVPGHHLQNALASEQGEQPLFRRYSYLSAYGEGWGLYSERLGVEMGIYETPYQQFGRLVYEMWRAARLVVDTGMHAKGWSRDQALNFMRDNTALSEHEITTEIDRYISWPGQALAYKLGELKIRELRAKAEAALGQKFDLRAFHDHVLALGSVPLSVLEQEVDRWIASQQTPQA
ncbi:DUF885 family protein [Permianibacter sp. IMCC34836]|uniref:DUF885 domain-containing protein n=1 Tax=Permianibacter fluminis TaxID=2738515 RepID=UPI001554F621|nr:DUF885 family protein [Permianibacter fluminis]NQD35781.1 DUF885 family protein [Permianibacter fluminis]